MNARRVSLLGAAVVAVACGVGLGAAQSIQLPDFREEARSNALCNNCATVRSVRELTTARERPAASALTPPPPGAPHQQVLVGAVFYHPLSDGAEGYAGGVGTPEMRARFATTSYEITLRMDDGSYRLVERRDGGRFRPGDRVRVVQGSLQPL